MKTSIVRALGVAGGILVACSPATLGADDDGRAMVILTGSRIPRQIHRVGRITDGPSAVTVIDRAQIERSGASTVVDVLRMDPAIRIRTGP